MFFFLRASILLLTLALLSAPLPAAAREAAGKPLSEGSGSLEAFDPDGKPAGRCPLKHTAVKAEISGFFASVEVTQTFENPFPQKIEAVYTFPLPENAAVHRMVMKIKERVVKGQIKRREEARQIYEAARDRGQIASLLDEERPNIFTQRVANIEPGAAIEIVISYLDVLPYKAGSFSFAFPTVVGPRYHPVGKVPDAGAISPPVAAEGMRAGHTISISARINAGVRIVNLKSELHEVAIERTSDYEAKVELTRKDEIPNRDFQLTYEVAEDAVKSGVICHKPAGGGDGYFTLVLIPPKRVDAKNAQPKEMIFVVDRSGSQSGLPLEKAKETLHYILDRMHPGDTFQLIDFASGYNKLFVRPMPASAEMVKNAKEYIDAIEANGGTEMAEAVRAACAEPADDGRLRIVTLMTDGYIGNDYEIVKMVKELRGKSRWFPFGTGNSVNRFLIDKMAAEGGGEAEYVLLNTASDDVARRFHEKIANPALTDIALSVEGVKVDEVYPKEPTDLWDRTPIVLKGRYGSTGRGVVVLRGQSAGKPYEERIEVEFPAQEEGNAAIRPVWARAKVDALMSRDWMVMNARGGDAATEGDRTALREEIVAVALAHSLLTPFTSFVAVEETIRTEGGKPVTVEVPVELPEGVSREGIFGKDKMEPDSGVLHRTRGAAPAPQSAAPGGAYAPAMDAAKVMRETEHSMPMPVVAPTPSTPVHYKKEIPPRPSSVSSSVAPRRGPRGGRMPEHLLGREVDGVNVIFPDFGGGSGAPAPAATGLSPELAAFVQRWKAGTLDDAAAESTVELTLSADCPKETLAKIESLAARVVAKLKGKWVVRVHAKHLTELAALTGVSRIAPGEGR